MKENVEEKLRKELETLFLDHPDGIDAKSFLANFGTYCHAIDDVIDRDIPAHPEQFGAILMMAANIYSCNFYLKNIQILYHATHMIHHMYFDSVNMERAPELWKKEQADTLKSIGIQMTLTIIEILGGYPKRRQLSQLVHEHAYGKQHDEDGNAL